MNEQRTYVGLLDDQYAGMTQIGRVIRDAWVFGLIPETETCTGWTLAQVEILYDKVSAAWAPYGHLASRLPPDLRERHARIYEAAIQRARDEGWDPESAVANEE